MSLCGCLYLGVKFPTGQTMQHNLASLVTQDDGQRYRTSINFSLVKSANM